MLGKTDKKENVYALSNDNGTKISEKLPSFDDESKVAQCKHDSFIKIFPSIPDKWDEFIEYDKERPSERSLTESVPALFPKLPFIKEAKDV